MLTPEENELLCRVEGDAPMGALMRRHWTPVCLAEEVAEPDGAPVKARVFGEDLVVFRDTDGRVGVMDEYCPHRRASLVFGRNEDCGLRCLYHGWKIDVDGNVVEMVSEPAAAWLAQKVKHKAYPVHENGAASSGRTWARTTDPRDAGSSRRRRGRRQRTRRSPLPRQSFPATGHRFSKARLIRRTVPACIHPTWCRLAWTARRRPIRCGCARPPTRRRACRWSANVVRLSLRRDPPADHQRRRERLHPHRRCSSRPPPR